MLSCLEYFFFLWLDDIIFLFGKGYQSRLYSLNVGSIRSGCCSVLEKMMGSRGSSMRYSYVCSCSSTLLEG